MQNTKLQTKFLQLIAKRCNAAYSTKVNPSLNYLAGKRVSSTDGSPTEDIELQNPATGEILGHIPSSGKNDVNAAVKSAKAAQNEWKNVPALERGKILSAAARRIREKSEQIAKVETMDNGKAIWEARADVAGCADSIEFYAGLAPTLTGEHFSNAGSGFGYTIREPLGVVGGIGAWNFPFQMAAWKSGPALACGNTMVFKPSQFTPLTTVMLAEIYSEAGLPDGCFNVVQGQGETGSLLSNHPDIAKMTFTGSVATGTKVMQACAKGIKHVTLELGGKSPLIIFADCDLDNAVGGAILANFLTQGQVCSNGTRVFVEKSIVPKFLDKLVERTAKMKIGDPNDEDTLVGAMINPAQGEKVLAYIESAKSEGAEVLFGGNRVDLGEKFKKGYFIRPCILTKCRDNMKVVKEEIFGSVMSVLEFETEEEVIKRANDTEFGLAGGVFTNDIKRAHRVASKIDAGTVYINTYNMYPVGLPFGGYKHSGFGRENGVSTVEYFTQKKTVYVEMGDVESPV